MGGNMSDVGEFGRGAALDHCPVAWVAPRCCNTGVLRHGGGLTALLPPGEDTWFHGRCEPKLPPCRRQRSAWSHAARRAVHLESRRGARGSRDRGGSHQWPAEPGMGLLGEGKSFLQGLALPIASG